MFLGYYQLPRRIHSKHADDIKFTLTDNGIETACHYWSKMSRIEPQHLFNCPPGVLEAQTSCNEIEIRRNRIGEV